MYLDNEYFITWMEKLSKKLTTRGSDLKAMMATGEAFANEDKLLDNQDLDLIEPSKDIETVVNFVIS